MKKVLIACFLSLVVSLPVHAKLKFTQKPDKNYDFKSVKHIVILPITSKDVDFGKVAKDRMPKIKSLLKKTKTNLRKHMVVGAKNAKTTIPFHYTAPNKASTTLILKYNIDQFDNGNMALRRLPIGGKAKVALTVQFLDGKKNVIAEAKTKGKGNSGIVGGGLDSEALWNAANLASSKIMRYVKKQTGFTYSFVSGATKGAKMGFEDNFDMIKEEKAEVKSKKKKK